MKTFTFSGFTVDLDRGRLLAAGRDVPLRPKSFEVLTYLVRSAGRVVSKDELVERVWRVAAVSDDSVSQCIRDIRRALGPAEGAIRTVRGRGYLFDLPESFIDATPGILQVDDPDSTPVRQRSPAVSSIAVLPFLSVVPDARNDALSLGLTDSLIYRLSRSARLQVSPLSAVRRFANLERDPLAAGRTLGVGAVVDGTLQLAAGRLRVGVRVLRVADQATLLAEELTEDGEDVLAVQSGLAARLASLVGPELESGEDTASSGAFEAVLLAQYELARRTPTGLAAALSHYERAVSLDPGYARAHAGMADLLAVLQVFGAASPHELAPRARAAAERAIALAPELADTHLALGMVKLHFDWDWAGAERHFRRAIAIQPWMAVPHQRLSLFLASIGSVKEALREAELAVSLEPSSAAIRTTRGVVLFLVGSYSEAETALLAVLREEPLFPLAHYWLAQDLAAQGRLEEALLEAEAAAGLGPTRPSWLSGYALARMGRTEEALAVAGALIETARVSYVPALDIASIYAGLDDRAEARRWLERAIRERSRGLDHLGASPVFAPYRGEEWFAALIREPLRLPPGTAPGG